MSSSAQAQPGGGRGGGGRGPGGGGGGGRGPGGGGGRGGGGRGPGGGGGRGGRGPLCLLRGTRILTSQGEVRVEDLRIGDLVETGRGEAMPIKWIGRNVYKRSAASWPKSIVPIRVSRFAIDEHTPHTDLYLSPGHKILIDGVFMRVGELVNGSSIAPAPSLETETIEYFNIMLDTHEVIWAEGAPVGTLLIESRDKLERFTNFVEYERLYGAESCPAMKPFAPICPSGARAHLKALLALGVFPIVDVRDPVWTAYYRAYDRLAARAQDLVS